MQLRLCLDPDGRGPISAGDMGFDVAVSGVEELLTPTVGLSDRAMVHIKSRRALAHIVTCSLKLGGTETCQFWLLTCWLLTVPSPCV